MKRKELIRKEMKEKSFFDISAKLFKSIFVKEILKKEFPFIHFIDNKGKERILDLTEYLKITNLKDYFDSIVLEDEELVFKHESLKKEHKIGEKKIVSYPEISPEDIWFFSKKKKGGK